MKIEEYVAQDGVGLAHLIALREVSPKEVLSAAAGAIARVDPILSFSVDRSGFDRARKGRQ